jgi:zinc transport system substrate-binding protein
LQEGAAGMMKLNTKIIKALTILIISVLMFSGCSDKSETKSANQTQQKFTIVTSFYPMYIHTINITKDMSGIDVVNMTAPQEGCLHGYQLIPDDLKRLERADVFVINGAGMESFIDKVIEQMPDLKIVEASKGIELIDEQHNDIGHQHENDLGHGENPHVWVSVSGAIAQVNNIASQLAEYDKKNAESYFKNAGEYVAKLESLREKMHVELEGIQNRNIVTFHEAFPYFAKEFNLNIAAVIEHESGSEPSPGELSGIISKIKELDVNALFVEPQYSSKTAYIIARETGAEVYTLDPGVTGEVGSDTEAYIKMMENNLRVLQEALN